MSQSLAQIYLHVVFSTKERRPYLQSDKTLTRMHEYLGGICRELDCPAIRIGGVEDHVHALCRLGRSVRIADLVRDLKRDSSKWVKEKFSDLPDFAWQSGTERFRSLRTTLIDSFRTSRISRSIIAESRFRMSFGDYSVSTTSSGMNVTCGIE